MFEIFGSGKPKRLFVGGLHGKEGLVTQKVFSELVKSNFTVKEGCLIIRNFSLKTRYVSTLEREFYNTETGKKLLKLIRSIKPEIYVEFHSYPSKSYPSLTSEERRKTKGVPPLIDLSKGLLFGSVSPLIRKTEFKKRDFCALLEIPKKFTGYNEVINLCKIFIKARNREEIVEEMEKIYPEQMKQVQRNYLEFYSLKI